MKARISRRPGNNRRSGSVLADRFPLTPQVAFRMIPCAGRQEVARPSSTSRRKSVGTHGSGPSDHPLRLPGRRPRLTHLACLIGLAALALFPGLGGSARLTYHEAFVAQGAREILISGQWMYPTIGGLPWLEKPPLPWWLAAAFGRSPAA